MIGTGDKVIEGNQIKALYMGCRYVKTNQWFPIAKITWEVEDGEYCNIRTVYLKGAEKLRKIHPNPHVVGFGSLDRVRIDRNLSRSPISNRLPLVRPIDSELKQALGFDPDREVDPIQYAARSGSYRHGDNRDLFPQIIPDNSGNYNFYFLPSDCYTFVKSELSDLTGVEIGQECHFDGDQLLLDDGRDMGTVPGYIKDLIGEFGNKLELSIVKISPNFPLPYSLLIRARLNRIDGTPFAGESYGEVQ